MDWHEYPGFSHPVLFDVRGHRRSASLFKEATQDTNCAPIFTLKDHDIEGYPSAYVMYMESLDEYDAAMKIVGGMAHWRKLMSCKWFMDGDPELGFLGLTQWRKDMAARDASEAKRELLVHVRNGDRQAAQYLLTYATKGDTAGTKQSTKTKKPESVTPRRGNSLPASVVDLSKAASKITNLD